MMVVVVVEIECIKNKIKMVGKMRKIFKPHAGKLVRGREKVKSLQKMVDRV